MTQSLCDVVDDMTGAICTNETAHEGAHRDETDPGCVLTFPDTSLVVIKTERPASTEEDEEAWFAQWFASEQLLLQYFG